MSYVAMSEIEIHPLVPNWEKSISVSLQERQEIINDAKEQKILILFVAEVEYYTMKSSNLERKELYI